VKRRKFITLLGGAAALPLAARAQRLAKITRIGWLVFGTSELGHIDKTLMDALAQRGLIHGRNIDVTFRYANAVSTRLPELARELAAQKPEVLIGIINLKTAKSIGLEVPLTCSPAPTRSSNNDAVLLN
jgi:putative ABC transport system substrate-binding protein